MYKKGRNTQKYCLNITIFININKNNKVMLTKIVGYNILKSNSNQFTGD